MNILIILFFLVGCTQLSAQNNLSEIEKIYIVHTVRFREVETEESPSIFWTSFILLKKDTCKLGYKIYFFPFDTVNYDTSLYHNFEFKPQNPLIDYIDQIIQNKSFLSDSFKVYYDKDRIRTSGDELYFKVYGNEITKIYFPDIKSCLSNSKFILLKKLCSYLSYLEYTFKPIICK